MISLSACILPVLVVAALWFNPYLAHGFVFTSVQDDGELQENMTCGSPAIWESSPVTMNLNFGDSDGTLINGTTSWDKNALSALNEWNKVGADFQWTAGSGTASPCLHNDQVDSTGWESTDCGDSFGDAVALTHVTFVQGSNGRWYLTDTDVVCLMRRLTGMSIPGICYPPLMIFVGWRFMNSDMP